MTQLSVPAATVLLSLLVSPVSADVSQQPRRMRKTKIHLSSADRRAQVQWRVVHNLEVQLLSLSNSISIPDLPGLIFSVTYELGG